MIIHLTINDFIEKLLAYYEIYLLIIFVFYKYFLKIA